jgi:hypothetical protein
MSRIRLADTSVDSIVHLVGALHRSALAEDTLVLMPDDSRIELLRNGSLRFERKPGERKAICTEVLERLNDMGVFD